MTRTDQTTEAAEEAQHGLRLLEIAVYIMGGLLVLMLLGLLGGIAWKLTHRTPEVTGAGTVNIAVPEGASIAGVTLDGDRMAVHIVKGADHEFMVVDIRKGTVVSRVRLTPGGAVRP